MAHKRKHTLIINADDMGYTRGVNRAIANLCDFGSLRSSTIMANGPACDHAISVARATPDLGVGVHLVLTGLKALTRPGEAGALVDETGELPKSPSELIRQLLLGNISSQAIHLELDRQVSRVVDCGIRPTHLDSHKHVHLIPAVLDALIAVARRHSIKWLRNPFDSTPTRLVHSLLGQGARPLFLRQALKAKLVWSLRPCFVTAVRRSGLQTPDRFYGVPLTGLWNPSAVEALTRTLRPGVTEWMIHPGDCDADLLASPTRLRLEREHERDLFGSESLMSLLRSRGVEPTSFGEEVPSGL